MPTYEDFREQVKADYQQLFAAMHEYAATGNPEAKRKMQQMEEIVWFKSRMLNQVRSARPPGNAVQPGGKAVPFHLPISLN